VFALAGGLVIEAAVTYKPAKAGGIDKALLTLRNQPLGEFLLILPTPSPSRALTVSSPASWPARMRRVLLAVARSGQGSELNALMRGEP
jgi:Domain of Unknown Function (DUF1206)